MILVGRPLSVFLTLTPFRKLSLRSKTFVSWVGLRGAVPIIFATYPVVAGVEGASQIFNIVFFVTLLSLIVQGTTVIAAARRLGLVEDEAPQADEFGIQLDDDMPTSLHTLVLSEEHFLNGNTLGSMSLPEGALVIMIKRGDRYIVPNGTMALLAGDTLLLMQEVSEIGFDIVDDGEVGFVAVEAGYGRYGFFDFIERAVAYGSYKIIDFAAIFSARRDSYLM